MVIVEVEKSDNTPILLSSLKKGDVFSPDNKPSEYYLIVGFFGNMGRFLDNDNLDGDEIITLDLTNSLIEWYSYKNTKDKVIKRTGVYQVEKI